jgi:2'-5' RNA ligase
MPVKKQVPARWTRPENLHLTLQFLGEQPSAAVSGLTEALDRQLLTQGLFPVLFSGFGTFRAASACSGSV